MFDHGSYLRRKRRFKTDTSSTERYCSLKKRNRQKYLDIQSFYIETYPVYEESKFEQTDVHLNGLDSKYKYNCKKELDNNVDQLDTSLTNYDKSNVNQTHIIDSTHQSMYEHEVSSNKTKHLNVIDTVGVTTNNTNHRFESQVNQSYVNSLYEHTFYKKLVSFR